MEMDMKVHMAHKAWILLIFGILLILNAILGIVSWVIFAGIIAIIMAIVAFIAHGSCCKAKKK
jgi:hypothetical protein